MSGGKGGSETTETTIPAWIRDPAIRNLARAEAVQRIPYMPYYGPDVAAFTPTQNAAFDQNIGAAEAFGLLAPNTLTATSGMPAPTDWDGFTGYSSQPMYESALAELKANQPGAVAQYDALFGGNVPTTWGNNPRFRGSAGGGGGGGGSGGRQPITTQGFGDTLNLGGGPMSPADALDQLNRDRSKIIQKNPDGSFVNVLGTGDAEAQRKWNEITARGGYDSYNKLQQRDDIYGTYTAPSPSTVAGPLDYLQPDYLKKKVDKMIPDNTVQKERAIMDAGGFSPNMAQFLINDANKIMNTNKTETRNPNFPEVHYPLDKGERMIVKDLGQPPNVDKRLNANPNIVFRGLW